MSKRTHYGNRGDWDDTPLPPADFPYADAERREDAPAYCDRCHTGLWKVVDDGYQCRQCPRRYLVAECLRAMGTRAIDRGERWPSVRLYPGAPRRSG